MILCFDIGGSAIKAALAREPSELETLGRVPTPLADFDAFVAALAAFTARHRDAAVAISITGVVDPATGRIKCANIPAIDGRALATELSTRLDRKVFVGNDADLFALAEAGAGAGRGHRIVFGAIFGTGVGGGLVIDGQMITGAGGFAGEWGHGPVAATIAGDPPVAIPRFACGCGQAGCVDTIGGARGLERLHAHLSGQSMSSVEIVSAWRAGDAASSRTIDCYVDLVASPLALVVNIVGADIVPTGGGLGALPDLMARVDIAVRGRILRQTATPIVVPGSLETEPGLVGAALMGFAGRSQ